MHRNTSTESDHKKFRNMNIGLNYSKPMRPYKKRNRSVKSLPVNKNHIK